MYIGKSAIWHHEGGELVLKEQYGVFDDRERAQEKCDELNEKIDIPLGGFRPHPVEEGWVIF